jgi:hypothetical protein
MIYISQHLQITLRQQFDQITGATSTAATTLSIAQLSTIIVRINRFYDANNVDDVKRMVCFFVNFKIFSCSSVIHVSTISDNHEHTWR